MPDKMGAPVEGFRITEPMQDFIKSYKRLKAVENVLKNTTIREQIKMATLTQMWHQLNRRMADLKEQLPQEKVRELSGMDFTPSPNELADVQQKQQMRY